MRVPLAMISLLLLAGPGVPAQSAVADGGELHLIPRPKTVRVTPGCRVPLGFTHRQTADVASKLDVLAASAPARKRGMIDGLDLLLQRWAALSGAAPAAGSNESKHQRGRPLKIVAGLRLTQERTPSQHAQAYRLTVSPAGAIDVWAGGDDGAFYALVTLSQLLERTATGWNLPCVTIEDEPALTWRILSDDISRGPLPTMTYFKERIRTIASLKMNGYAPYVEHVVFDPREPLPSPLDGLTDTELAELNAYAERYHVALIPQQQTFAHMHNSLRWERYAPLAETPHGYLLSPANPAGAAYAQELIRNQLSAVPNPPFFHIGADEPVDLGRGQAGALVAREGEGPVYTRFVTQMAHFVASRGTRPMIWDDALERHPELFGQLPKSLVFVNWHYGDEATYKPFIDRIASGGFDQMVAPGSRNWNEIYPDLSGALGNIDRFVTEGKNAHVLGLYQTVWHDDGETLFEATWLPVAYAAASGWEAGSVPRERFLTDFPQAFFGVDDPGYAHDFEALAGARDLLRATGTSGDYLYWADPFDARFSDRVSPLVDAAALRLKAESVIAHLRTAPPPPLHANTAAVMGLAARRYDQLGRNLQIAKEARNLFADAGVQLAAGHDTLVERDLFLTKYLFWEQRDAFLELVPLVAAARQYENRPSHALSVLERYHAAADRAIARADAVNRAVYEFVEPAKTLPPLDRLLAPTLPSPP
jgi:hypothetical protein